MPLVKVKQKYQVTIPATIREQVELDIGDMLEATISKEGILLKPQVVADRKPIIAKLEKALKKKTKGDPYLDKTDSEIMKEALKIVKAARKDRKSKRVS